MSAGFSVPLGGEGNLDAYLTATRRGGEDAPVELLRNFDRFTFFERLANAERPCVEVYVAPSKSERLAKTKAQCGCNRH